MLCDSCIKELALDTSREAPRVLKALLNDGQLNKREIKDKAGLSYAVNQRVVGELEAKMFIGYKFRGQSNEKLYHITETGQRLLKLYKEELS